MDLYNKFFPTRDELIARAVPSGRHEAVVQMVLSLAARGGTQDPFVSDDTLYDIDLCVAQRQNAEAQDRLKQQRDFVDKTKKLLASLRSDSTLPSSSRVVADNEDEESPSEDAAAAADHRFHGGATRIQSSKPVKMTKAEIAKKLARITSLESSIEHALSEILEAQDKISSTQRDIDRLTNLQRIAHISTRRLRMIARTFRHGGMDEVTLRKTIEYDCERARFERKKFELPAPPVRVMVTTAAGNHTFKEYDADEYWLLRHPVDDGSAW
jgi:hypothetical protein